MTALLKAGFLLVALAVFIAAFSFSQTVAQGGGEDDGSGDTQFAMVVSAGCLGIG